MFLTLQQINEIRPVLLRGRGVRSLHSWTTFRHTICAIMCFQYSEIFCYWPCFSFWSECVPKIHSSQSRSMFHVQVMQDPSPCNARLTESELKNRVPCLAERGEMVYRFV
jgi:hypothetical protein